MKTQIKTLVKTRLPVVVNAWRQVRLRSIARKTPKQVFSDIYTENHWGNEDSVSGPGSDLSQTEAIRRELPGLVREYGCRSMLDVPCGDYYWMKLVDLEVDYVGGDIVEEMIRGNREKYAAPNRRFITLDLLEDPLPKVDLVFCRDCLVHFSYKHMYRALDRIKRSGSEYLLTTTFVDRTFNENIPTGAWRPINLQIPPFNLPDPIRLIDEACPSANGSDKHMGLWRTRDIPDFG